MQKLKKTNTKDNKEEKGEKLVTLTATQNTKLADGTFVAKGEQVEVTAEYAERLKAEKNKSLK